jgi:hypothetical protein
VTLTLEQITQMAPDESSASAGRKLMALKSWKELGRSDVALWGLCLGSATYQVKVELGALGYKCSCPSRKFPCKHVLGLLMLATATPDAVKPAACPEWVSEWLQQRQEKDAKKEQKAKEKADKPVDEKAQQKRAEQRHERVREGLERLDLWLRDLVRGGLAGLETKGSAPWEDQARRLVDAQAPGLASRIRRLGDVPGTGRDWPRQMVEELGRVKLAVQAFQRIEQLEPGLATDLRQMLGWTISSEELEKVGECVEDEWAALGQWIDDDDRIRTLRTWCVGRSTGRFALVLQFAVGGQPLTPNMIPGSVQRGTMVFYPGASRQRALFTKREESPVALSGTLPGAATIEQHLDAVAKELARQPWLSSFGCVLQGVVMSRRDEEWFVVDREGRALPLLGQDHWRLLAITGGHPFDLLGEWNGRQVRPLGLLLDGKYRVA